MREATAKCLRDNFCADSMAHARYLIYAKKAREEGFPSIANLLQALALSRYVRASDEYRLTSDLIGTHTASVETYFTLARTVDNLERARDVEASDAEETLQAYIAVAERQGEGAAIRSLKCSASVCRRRAARLDEVIQVTKHANEEPQIGPLLVCVECGYIADDQAPDECPLCGNDPAGFVNASAQQLYDNGALPGPGIEVR